MKDQLSVLGYIEHLRRYDTLEYACGFSSEQCPEGVVAISTNTLRILALEKLGAVFNQVTMPIKYTPRKFWAFFQKGDLSAQTLQEFPEFVPKLLKYLTQQISVHDLFLSFLMFGLNHFIPGKFIIDEESSNMIMIETDHNTFTENSKAQVFLPKNQFLHSSI